MKHIKNIKPSMCVCPKEFCFFWDSVELNCRESFGKCLRDQKSLSDRDCYEPCEPELERAGLPWFYFIPNADDLNPLLNEEYLRESEKLWDTTEPEKIKIEDSEISLIEFSNLVKLSVKQVIAWARQHGIDLVN